MIAGDLQDAICEKTVPVSVAIVKGQLLLLVFLPTHMETENEVCVNRYEASMFWSS